MNEATIKELLSVNYARVLAEYAGLTTVIPTIDVGDDMIIQSLKTIENQGRFSYVTSGGMISVQMKCTTQKLVRMAGKSLLFNLKVKNYNHLIIRRKLWSDENFAPLILFILVLPENKRNWLTIDKKD